MAGQERDYYTLLGVGRNASATDIERAYRRAARATHPDIHPEDSSANERFSALAIAYETLGNPARRASYDRAQARLQPLDPGHISHRRPRPVDVAPVHLGRSRVSREPLQPFHDTRVELVADDLLELIATLRRLINGWRVL